VRRAGVQISTDYGVLIEGAGVALRGLFIICDTGVIRHITINDLPVGRNAEEVIRLVQAFIHTDKHGEVCPAGWTPGAATVRLSLARSRSVCDTVVRQLTHHPILAAAAAAATAANITGGSSSRVVASPLNVPTLVAFHSERERERMRAERRANREGGVEWNVQVHLREAGRKAGQCVCVCVEWSLQ